MRCPFLREGNVKTCAVSPHRKAIPSEAIAHASDRCHTGGYLGCPAASARLTTLDALAQCPFLHETLMQHCAAAPVVRYVPWNDGRRSRCNGDAHRFCLLFLDYAEPTGPAPASALARDGRGIQVPCDRIYSRNHMWLEQSRDGSCHVGLDGFFARVFGRVDGIVFASHKALQEPAVVVRTSSLDLLFAFPLPVELTATNASLLSDPSPIAHDPYGRGWLFEGLPPSMPHAEPESPFDALGLVAGADATEWVRAETKRLAAFAHERLRNNGTAWPPSAADGATFAPGVAQQLTRAGLLDLYLAFFPPT
jgi:glycine cleavage system H lipoate-binding protein